MSSLAYSTCYLEDGASLAYELYGDNHKLLPLVLVGGLSNTRGDWQRLALPLAKTRSIIVYDHRGIGDSQFSSPDGDNISIESMARDLKALIKHLGYGQVAICGYSMGGVIAQQLLFLPYHPTRPTDLGFEITHILLTATMTSVLQDPNYGPPMNPKSTQLKIGVEQARPMVESMFDPVWIADPNNSERLEERVQGFLVKRPFRTIAKQFRAAGKYDFSPYYEHLSDSKTHVLVIHGKLDRVLPFSGQDEILSRYPLARAVEIGPSPGQVPNLSFGHAWFEYFDADVWVNVIETFLNEKRGRQAPTKLQTRL